MESEAVVNAVLVAACLALVIALVKKIFFPEKFTPTTADKLPEIDPRDFTLAELCEFDGSDPSKPLLVALSGNVYDVTPSKGMYGPGGSYHLFAGRDASRALATMNLSQEALADEWDDLSDLAKDEKQILHEWEEKFVMKYKCIGALLRERDKRN